MSERYRFISQAVSERWRSIKKKTKDLVAAGTAVPAILSGVQTPAYQDVFHDISRPAIVENIQIQDFPQVVFHEDTLRQKGKNKAQREEKVPEQKPIVEVQIVQETSRTESTGFENDMAEIAKLQKIFNDALGVESNGQEEIRSYNPVLARWKFEQLKTEEEKNRFKKYELKQMETNLRERYHAAQSVINYTMDNEGNVYNELFPDEPFVKVLERGVVYRRTQGSSELEREERELVGFIKNMKKLRDPNTPVGAKMICISPPGIVVDTTYKDNFVDFLEVKEDPETGVRKVQLTRFKSDMGYKDYVAIYEQEKPGFFKSKTGPIDAIILEEGIYTEDSRTPHEIFAEKFGGPSDGMKEDDFNKYIYAPTLALSINYIEEELCAGGFFPIRVAKAFNAILVAGDEGKLKWEDDQENGEKRVFKAQRVPALNMRAFAQLMGERQGETITAGCGSSSGFSFRNPFEELSNSVAKFGIQEPVSKGERILECYCPKCDPNKAKGKVKAKIGNGKITCPRCDESAPYEC